MFDILNVLIYAPAGHGKTTGAIRAVPVATTFYLELEQGAFTPLTSPGLNPWRNRDGSVMLPKPWQYAACLSPLNPAHEVRQVVTQRIAPLAKQGKIRAICVSTLTAFDQRLYDRLMGQGTEDNYGKKADTAAREVRFLTASLQALGIVVIAEAHQRNFTDYNGKITQGGPKIQGERAVDQLVGTFSIVLRVTKETLASGEGTYVYRCAPFNMQYRTRDRYHLCRDVEPAKPVGALNRILARAWAQARGQEVPPPLPLPDGLPGMIAAGIAAPPLPAAAPLPVPPGAPVAAVPQPPTAAPLAPLPGVIPQS